MQQLKIFKKPPFGRSGQFESKYQSAGTQFRLGAHRVKDEKLDSMCNCQTNLQLIHSIKVFIILTFG